MNGAVQGWLSGRWVLVVAYVLIVLTVYTAALIRFYGVVPVSYASRFASSLPVVVTALQGTAELRGEPRPIEIVETYSSTDLMDPTRGTSP